MSRDLSTARPVGRRNLDPAGAIIGSGLPNEYSSETHTSIHHGQARLTLPIR
jgi:hypothetical protein